MNHGPTPTCVLFGVAGNMAMEFRMIAERAGWVVVAALLNQGTAHPAVGPARDITPDTVHEWLQHPFVVPIGGSAARNRASAEAQRLGLRPASAIVDPSAVLLTADLAAGVVISPLVSVGAAARLREGVFINRSGTVGHDSVLLPFVTVGPGATVAGGVTIGPRAFVGAGATVLPELSIGADAVIGAGAVVTRDVPQGVTVVGNPARVLRAGPTATIRRRIRDDDPRGGSTGDAR